MQKEKQRLIIIGASGHGKVIADIALKNGYKIEGFLDDNTSLNEVIGFPIVGTSRDIDKYKDTCKFVIAIGSNSIRKKISQEYEVAWATLIHPSAIVGIDVHIDEGTVVMPNAIINASARIGKHCIINTGVIIEHDNFLEDYVHISPNATLAGTVKVGCMTHIGVGVTVKNNLEIAKDVIVGAGAVVIKDIKESGIYVGVPVRKIL